MSKRKCNKCKKTKSLSDFIFIKALRRFSVECSTCQDMRKVGYQSTNARGQLILIRWQSVYYNVIGPYKPVASFKTLMECKKFVENNWENYILKIQDFDGRITEQNFLKFSSDEDFFDEKEYLKTKIIIEEKEQPLPNLIKGIGP